MDLKTLLRRLPPQDGDLTVEVDGVCYPMPYETLSIEGREIKGVRENRFRFALLHKLMAGVHPCFSLLDIGSNMGTTAAHFAQSFDQVTGIEAQLVYHSLARELWPHVRFIHSDLNRTTLGRLMGGEKFSVVLALSMIEYIRDKETFVRDLYNATEQVCIVEGHSEDIYPRQRHLQYEALLKTQAWTVERCQENTDPGLNAPKWSQGRPVWVCRK